MRIKQGKKLHLLVWILGLILYLGFALPVSAEEGSGIKTYGNWQYQVEEDNTVTVLGYLDDETEELTIPSEIDGKLVKTIGEEAFMEMEWLQSVVVPESVTRIEKGAFSGCVWLGEINIPSGVTFIGAETFYSCTELREITLPEGLTSIEPRLFTYCTFLEKTNIPAGVTSIGAGAFSRTSIKHLDIPVGVTSIGAGAFMEMEDMVIPSGLTELGDGAFSGCTFGDVVIPEGITVIGQQTFERCTFQSLTLHEGITAIGKYAFMGANVDKIYIPQSVTGIGEGAFSGCSMRKLTIECKSGILEPMAFANCGNLVEVSFGEGITSIGEQAFTGCSALTEISLPDTVTSIGKSAFYSCCNLTTVKLSANVKEIGELVFALCEQLTDIELPQGLVYIGKDAFNYCTQLKEIVIPGSVETIDDNAFLWCWNLANVTMEEGVKTIGSQTFMHTHINRLILPASVETIGEDAFEASMLASISILNPDCEIFDSETTVPVSGYGDGIRGLEGSTAQAYAEKYGYDFYVVDPSNPDDNEQIRNFVARMYYNVLERDPDPAGQAEWVALLVNKEVTGADVARGFIMSEEFVNKNCTIGDYVSILYWTFFDREMDAAGGYTWTELLLNGTPRSEVLAGFVNSVEFDALCAEYGILRGQMDASGNVVKVVDEESVTAYVERMYTKALVRSSDPEGLATWSNLIVTGQMSPEDVAKSFFLSEEFVNKNLSNEDYVETLYQTFMDRASDPAGKADWVNYLNNGMDRVTVLEGFSRSVEFAAIVEQFGL